MDETNPLDVPSASSQSATDYSSRSMSVTITSILGGLIGFVVGVIGVVAIFFVIPGMPGVAELLLLLIGISIFLVVPGAFIGAVIGFVVNSRQ